MVTVHVEVGEDLVNFMGLKFDIYHRYLPYILSLAYPVGGVECVRHFQVQGVPQVDLSGGSVAAADKAAVIPAHVMNSIA